MKTLLAVDGSEGSRSAASLVHRLMDGCRDEVVLCYCLPTTQFRDGEQDANSIRARAEQGLASRVFEHAKKELSGDLADRVTEVISHEHPRAGILKAADEFDVDLIALGARGLNPLSQILLGSVSRSVVHQSTRPVLVGRETLATGEDPLRVLFACDRDGVSQEATELTGQLDWPETTEGHLIHVIESLFDGQVPEWLRQRAEASDDEPLSRLWVEQDRQERQAAREELLERREQLAPPFQSASLGLLEGHPGEQLVAYVRQHQIDLALIGARRLGAFERFFTGSTSDYLLTHAACSVLLVPHADQAN